MQLISFIVLVLIVWASVRSIDTLPWKTAAAITNINTLDTDVNIMLASPDSSKSSGIDGIGPNILK